MVRLKNKKTSTIETPKETLLRWSEWSGKITVNTIKLLRSRDIYRGYLDVLKNNSSIQNPITFHNWVRNNYGNSVASHIRRELGTGRDEISLIKLLDQIKSKPHLITKSWHAEIYKGSSAEDFADSTFKRLAGTGDVFDGEIAKQDAKRLRELGSDIEAYVTNRIAHEIDEPLKKEPSYDDLDKFIDEYQGIVKKYNLLFTGSSNSLTTHFQGDWQEIFRKPWIEDVS